MTDEKRKKIISIVIPAFNEEDVLEELKLRLQNIMRLCDNYNFEVIIVENGSWDTTFQKLLVIHEEDPRFKIVQLSRNFGCDGGISAGMQFASGDSLILMCADLQDEPELIPEFIKKWELGYDVVYGIVNDRAGIKITRKIASSMYYKIFNKLTKSKIPDNVSDFRLIDRKVQKVILSMPERNRLLRGMIAWSGFKQIGIPFERPPRFAGESKADFFTVFKTAMDGIYSFSDIPLKLATVLGCIISIIAVIIIIVELISFLVYEKEISAITILLIIFLFLFGLLFFVIGIIGEYISRIYDEAKQRPVYLVNDLIGFSD
jgi:polyisoprenyl-phosphate glycosyltransferase